VDGVTVVGYSAFMIAALYVLDRGPYFGLPDVDPWPESRDARSYAGPHPVVAHPPCERWGRYAAGGPSHHGRFTPGDDGGCFEAALAAVRRWGGVLEHPAASLAWGRFGIAAPPRGGGWVRAEPLSGRGWTCCVDQGHYGHRASKATWIYAVGCELPALAWGPCEDRVDTDGITDPIERRRLIRRGVVERMSKRQRAETPEPFRDLLLNMARSVGQAANTTGETAYQGGAPCVW
jgi:hypothetical protein